MKNKEFDSEFLTLNKEKNKSFGLNFLESPTDLDHGQPKQNLTRIPTHTRRPQGSDTDAGVDAHFC